MGVGSISLTERLRRCANAGLFQAKLRLYKSQADYLVLRGFVTKGLNDSSKCYPGQDTYLIDWSEPRPGTVAYDFFETATHKDDDWQVVIKK